MHALTLTLALTNVLVRWCSPGAGAYWLLGSPDFLHWDVIACGVTAGEEHVCACVPRKDKLFVRVEWKSLD